MKNSALFVLCALLTACGGSDDNKTTNQTTIQSYTITTNVEGEGQLQPTSLVLKQGESGTFELKPEQGHQVASVEGCNGTYSDNKYTIESATQSCQVSATFEAKTINVALKSDSYITLNTDKNDYVYGDSAVISYELSSGYLVNEITGCNGVLNDELYKVDALTADCQITATTLPTSQVFSGEDEAQVNVTVLDGKGSILSSSKGVIESSNPELPALNSSLEFERDLLAVDISTEAGQTIELQIIYETPLPTQFTYQKLIEQQWQALDQENVAVSEDRSTLTLTLTDGGAGDSDGVINGVIKDPGGPAVVKMHTVTVNPSNGGALTPESLAVAHGETGLFTISTDPGYTIESVTGCNGTLNGTSYQTAAITQNCEISAEFSLRSFLVTAQAGEGGQISPLEQLASYGDTLTFTVTSDDDHNIESVQGCNGSLAGNIYTTGIITAACEVRATFDSQTVLVTAQAGMGGSISPMSQELNIGQQASLIVTPNEGYSIANVTGCSGSLNGNTYTTSAITANCQVQASFSIDSYTVNASAGEGGAVTPTTQSVNHGSSAKIIITPNSGYNIDAVTGCSGSLNGNTYTTSAITANCQVQASFSIDSYTVNASASEGGTVTPTTQSVNHGSSAKIIITPNSGYNIDAVTGCSGSLSGNTYTTSAVTANCQVQASFSIDSYTVSASAGEGGTVNPATKNVNHGSRAQITITPNEGYSIDAVTGCSGSLSGNTYTTSAVTANCQVQASFSINSYTVSASAGEGGTVNPATQNVNHGSSAQITITPNSGYNIDAVTGCNGSLNGNIYTTGAVTANCSVMSTFIDNRPEYQVSILTSVGGSVSENQILVKADDEVSFDITANEGFFIFDADGCGGQLAGNTYTTGTINNDCSVAVQFKENTPIADNTKIISLNTPQPNLMELVWLVEGSNLTEQEVASATHRIYISEQPIEDITQATMAKEVVGVFTTQLEALTANTQYYIKIQTQVGSTQLLSAQESITTPKQAVVETGITHTNAEELLLEPLAITSNTITYRSSNNSELPKAGDLLYSNDLEKLGEFNYLRKVVSTQTNNNQVEVITESAGISDIVQNGEFNSSFTLFEPVTYEPQNNTVTNRGIQANKRKLQTNQYKTNTQVTGQELEQRIIMKDAGLMVVQRADKNHSPEVKQYIEQNEKIRSLQQPLSFTDKLLAFVAPNQSVQEQSTQSSQVKHGIMFSGIPEQLRGNFDDKFSFQSHILLVEPEKYSLNNITWSLTHSNVEDNLENFGATITANTVKNTDWPIYFEWQPAKYHGVTKGKAYTLSITVEVQELDCSFSCKEEVNIEFPITINEITNELDDGISINLPANRIGKVGQNLELDFSAEIAKQSDIDDDIAITGYEVLEFKIGKQNFELPEFKNGFSDSSSNVSDILNWYPTSVQFEVFSELYEQQGKIVPFELTVAVTAKDLECSRTLDWCEDDTVEIKVDLFIQKDISLGTGSKRIMLYENSTKTVQLGFDYELGFEPRLDMGVELQGGEIDNARLMLGGKLDFDLEAFATLEGKYEKIYKTGDMSEKDENNQPIYDRKPLYKKTYYKIYALGYVPVVQQIDFIIDAEATFSADASIEFKNDFSFSKFIEMGLVYENGQWQRIQNDGTTQSLEFTTKVAANASLNVKLIPKLSTTFYKVATAGLALEPALNTSLGAEGILQVDHNSQEDFYNYRLYDATASYHIALTGWADLSVWGKTLVKYPKDTERALIWEYPAQGNEAQQRAATLFSVPAIELGIAQHRGATVTLEATTQAGRNVFSSNKTNEFVPLSNAWQVFTLSNSGQTSAPFQLTEPQAELTNFTGQLGNVYTIYYVGHDSVIGALARNYQSLEIDYTDEDADGMPLYWEQLYCINGASPDYRGEADIDNDGLTNLEEFTAGTQPNTCDGSNASQDSDGDGMPDGWEVKYGLNPLADDAQKDPDGDGIVNIDEYQAGTDPSPVRTQITAIEILGQTSLEHGQSAQFTAQVTYSDNSTEQVQGLWQLSEEYEGLALSPLGLLTTQALDKTRTIKLSIEFLGESSTFEVTLTPTLINTAPIANAGDDQTVPAGSNVTLDAAMSSDVEDDNAQIPLTFYWEQINSTEYAITLSDDSSSRPTFTAPETRERVSLQFELTVTDSQGLNNKDRVEIIIEPKADNLASINIHEADKGVVVLRNKDNEGLTTTFLLYFVGNTAVHWAYHEESKDENTGEITIDSSGSGLGHWEIIGDSLFTLRNELEIRTNEGRITEGGNISLYASGVETSFSVIKIYEGMVQNSTRVNSSDLVGFSIETISAKEDLVLNIISDTEVRVSSVQNPENVETYQWKWEQDFLIDFGDGEWKGDLYPSKSDITVGDKIGSEHLSIAGIVATPPILTPIEKLEFSDLNLQQCVNDEIESKGYLAAEQISSLNCANLNIQDSSGLEQLTGLIYLDLSDNQLSSINLDDNLALNSVDLRGNEFDQATLEYLAAITRIADLKYLNTPPPTTATVKLNDTGITRCADGNNNKLDCPVTDYEGQDAEYGRDAQAKAGTLEKVGGGNAGFDFTKLDANGNDLPESATAWSCVRDNHTGLIWEVKTDDGSLHDKNDRYNWYNPDSNTNGGHPGYQDDDGNICYGYDANNQASYCNTHAYVERVNKQSLCGANDWRLPTRLELMGIMDNGTKKPAIDWQYFPETQVSWFWSSSPHAKYSDEAWNVSFSNNKARYDDGSEHVYVRLVRGRP